MSVVETEYEMRQMVEATDLTDIFEISEEDEDGDVAISVNISELQKLVSKFAGKEMYVLEIGEGRIDFVHNINGAMGGMKPE